MNTYPLSAADTGRPCKMKMGVMHVTSTKKPPYRITIHTSPPWLADMGFVQGAPVWASPRQEGFTLALQGQNHGTETGKLIHVACQSNRGRLSITVNLSNNFSTTGLSVGDFLAAGYAYGIIEARKLPDAYKYYVVGVQNRSTFLQLSGAWLSDAGFAPNTVAAVSLTDDGITIRTLPDAAENYRETVKFARRHKHQIIQARRNQQVTTMDIPGYLLDNAGFGNGGLAGVRYEYGSIQLFNPDLRKLGF